MPASFVNTRGKTRGNEFYMHPMMRRCIVFPIVVLFVASGAAKQDSFMAPENFIWNGLNPFFQPAPTLNYYGSGDVDDNCTINRNDLDSLNRLISLRATFNYRADCNGDGKISSEDAALLMGFLDSQKTLPSHWNELTTREQRMHWLNQCLALDATAHLPYSLDFQCVQFACQLALNFSYYGGNLGYTKYQSCGTVYNMPVYPVNLSTHSINAILVGDSPLEFKDWVFIEPQQAKIVQPIDPDPLDTARRIGVVAMLYVSSGGFYDNAILTATRTGQGWTINKTASGLVTTRPPLPVNVDYVDMMPSWNPRIIRMGNSEPTILFERLNDRLPPHRSIYRASLGGGAISGETEIISDSAAPRLLDVQQSPAGGMHILWRGTTERFKTALYTGVIDPAAVTVKNVATFTGPPLPKAASMSVLSDDSVHVFWLTDLTEHIDSALSRGINQSLLGHGRWSPCQNVESFDEIYPIFTWPQRTPVEYVMSAVRFHGGPALICTHSGVHMKLPSAGGWKDFPTVFESADSGARAVIDGKNVVHCVYWRQNTGPQAAGKIVYQSFNDSAWSEPTVLDSSQNARCPDIAVSDRNDPLTVWEKDIAGQITAYCTRVCVNGVWRPSETHVAPENESVWYPRITALRDTNYAVSWESRGSYKTQVRFRLHAYSPPATMTHLGNALEPWKGTRMRFSGGMLHIANDGNVPASASIRLFDLQGRMLYQTQFRDARKCVIDLHRFGKGFRYVVISSGGSRYFEKINMSD